MFICCHYADYPQNWLSAVSVPPYYFSMFVGAIHPTLFLNVKKRSPIVMYIQITKADSCVMNKQSVKIAFMYDGSRTNVQDDESSGPLLVVTDGLDARIELKCKKTS